MTKCVHERMLNALPQTGCRKCLSPVWECSMRTILPPVPGSKTWMHGADPWAHPHGPHQLWAAWLEKAARCGAHRKQAMYKAPITDTHELRAWPRWCAPAYAPRPVPQGYCSTQQEARPHRPECAQKGMHPNQRCSAHWAWVHMMGRTASIAI